MAIHLNLKKEILTSEKESVLHLMPCDIHGDEPALVSSYFTPYIRRKDDEHLTTSFRGYPLQGKTITLPKGYTGLVLHESKNAESESLDRNLFATGKFTQFTYWNYDKLPSKNDAVVAALEWIDIAEALHSNDDDVAN
ncbi:ribonuclease H2 subunit C [Neodiprion pinetum]|uniref:Ribonuclease H2 subunit C n=1 Tax=Neodiprion lecontei TaxID=441921 RepID=A0A6J0B5V6_NEOLC|nr:ribonuclease H2 subunit C [Neodiprion lecontei]XP_046491426.1 ribonuclease H2 subunit C [Neodiprion pinetum]